MDLNNTKVTEIMDKLKVAEMMEKLKVVDMIDRLKAAGVMEKLKVADMVDKVKAVDVADVVNKLKEVDVTSFDPWVYKAATTASVTLIMLYLLYLYLLPKPIKGIPYNKDASKRLLGDLPSVMTWRKDHRELWSFFRQRAADMNSPIFQVFMRVPFGKPWVVIADFREAQDIQMNRQGEFDRSAFLADVFGPLLPGNHVWMPSNSTFRAHRSLIRDTMSPAFLNRTVAPGIYSSIMDMLDLWRERIRLGEGRPFAADRDIIRAVVDLILLATFGIDTQLSKSQLDLLAGLDHVDQPGDMKSPAVFPSAAESPVYDAVRTLVDSIQIGMSSPVPKHHMNFALRFFPSLAAARKKTDKMMGEVLDGAWKKFSGGAHNRTDRIASAADLLVQREALNAGKEKRQVKYDTRVIRDELFGFYLAGHETTSTTICWAVKRLTIHQEIQNKLRAALREAHPKATKEKRMPTAQEIVESDCPYLDAFVEENNRLGTAIPTVIRRTTRDAMVLGHMIPEGTDVFMLLNGPCFQQPGFEIDEKLRTQSTRDAKDKYGLWDDADVGEFKPERFLFEDGKGRVRYNPHAGPVLPYGVGLRSCFGIKLAQLELKVIITMIAWAFELRETPPPLSSMKAHDVNTHRADQTYLLPVEATF